MPVKPQTIDMKAVTEAAEKNDFASASHAKKGTSVEITLHDYAGKTDWFETGCAVAKAAGIERASVRVFHTSHLPAVVLRVETPCNVEVGTANAERGTKELPSSETPAPAKEK